MAEDEQDVIPILLGPLPENVPEVERDGTVSTGSQSPAVCAICGFSHEPHCQVKPEPGEKLELELESSEQESATTKISLSEQMREALAYQRKVNSDPSLNLNLSSVSQGTGEHLVTSTSGTPSLERELELESESSGDGSTTTRRPIELPTEDAPVTQSMELVLAENRVAMARPSTSSKTSSVSQSQVDDVVGRLEVVEEDSDSSSNSSNSNSNWAQGDSRITTCVDYDSQAEEEVPESARYAQQKLQKPDRFLGTTKKKILDKSQNRNGTDFSELKLELEAEIEREKERGGDLRYKRATPVPLSGPRSSVESRFSTASTKVGSVEEILPAATQSLKELRFTLPYHTARKNLTKKATFARARPSMYEDEKEDEDEDEEEGEDEVEEEEESDASWDVLRDFKGPNHKATIGARPQASFNYHRVREWKPPLSVSEFVSDNPICLYLDRDNPESWITLADLTVCFVDQPKFRSLVVRGISIFQKNCTAFSEHLGNILDIFATTLAAGWIVKPVEDELCNFLTTHGGSSLARQIVHFLHGIISSAEWRGLSSQQIVQEFGRKHILDPSIRQVNKEGLRILQNPQLSQFLFEGGAFMQLLANLEELLRPKPFTSGQLSQAIELTLTEVSSQREPAPMTRLLGNSLLILASSLLEADISTIHIISDYSIWYRTQEWKKKRILDPFKRWVERMTDTPWDWWPFSSPSTLVEAGYAVVEWTCACGEIQAQKVPSVFAQHLCRLLHHLTITDDAKPLPLITPKVVQYVSAGAKPIPLSELAIEVDDVAARLQIFLQYFFQSKDDFKTLDSGFNNLIALSSVLRALAIEVPIRKIQLVNPTTLRVVQASIHLTMIRLRKVFDVPPNATHTELRPPLVKDVGFDIISRLDGYIEIVRDLLLAARSPQKKEDDIMRLEWLDNLVTKQMEESKEHIPNSRKLRKSQHGIVGGAVKQNTGGIKTATGSHNGDSGASDLGSKNGTDTSDPPEFLGSLDKSSDASMLQSTSSSFGFGSQIGSDVSIETFMERFIFFGVATGEEYHLSQIETLKLSDDKFFTKLSEEYKRMKGWMRRWFSVWKYSHCDFSMFEKVVDHEITPVGERPSLPNNGDTQYIFKPRPAERVPPISPHEFKRRFYACYQGGKRHKHYLRSCRKQCRMTKDAVEKIPKRDRLVVEEGDGRDVFWGLLAVDIPSFAMTVVYTMLILVLPFVFWMIWLSKHDGDFQNGSVPILVVIGLMSIFWFPMLSR